MHIKMKIIEVWPAEHSVVVRYFSDKITEDMLAQHDGQGNIPRRQDGSPVRCRTDASVNIIPVPAPTDQALIEYIYKVSPPNHDWFELQEKIADPAVDTSMAGVESLRDKAVDAPSKPTPVELTLGGGVELRARRDSSRQIKTTVL